MKILETRVLRGPNRWSNYRKKLIEVRLDLEELEELPTYKIEGFARRLEQQMPSLYDHECSEGKPGGFFERVRRGTWMGHVVEHIALEMQTLAGMDCGFGRTRSTGQKGVYNVVFAYEVRSAGLFAAYAATRMAAALIAGERFDLDNALEQLRQFREAEGFSSFTNNLVRLFRERGIPLQLRDDNHSLVVGQGKHVKIVPLKSGHPCFPSPGIDELFNMLSDNSVSVAKDKIPEGENIYQFFLVKGKLVAGLCLSAHQPSILVLDKPQRDHSLHSENIFMVERVARLTGLEYCTIEISSKDISLPLNKAELAVTNIFPAPPLGWSAKAEEFMAGKICDELFASGEQGRIPVVAVTGTNGKTTTTRLIAHMAQAAGHFVGYTNTDGIYLGENCICTGDCSGPSSAELILRDNLVDFAVLECARGGIIRSGLGFDHCDVSVITNIAGDHLGLDGIHTNEDLARVKAVVAYATKDEGFAVLNTEDDFVYDLKQRLDCNLAMYGTKMNDRLRRHMQIGGLVAYIEDGYFEVCWHGCRSRVAKVNDTPLTFQGRAECMIRNILPCLCVAMSRGFSIASIREALESFVPGPRYTPGRMNLFTFEKFDVLVDYAHNPHGFREMLKFLRKTEAVRKVGVVGCPGDRLEEDIISMGYTAAEMFDEIIIRHDKDGRGRSHEAIANLVMEGIRAADRSPKISVISDELDAVRFAMSNAVEGTLIVTLTEDAKTVIGMLEEQQRDLKKDLLHQSIILPASREPVSGLSSAYSYEGSEG